MKISTKYFLCFAFAASLIVNAAYATITYTMTASNPGYTALSGGTDIPELSSGSDLSISPQLPIGFSFEFDGTMYTDFQVSDNGYLSFAVTSPVGYGNAFGDAIIPNDLSAPNTTRPFIAPLWEELAVANIGGYTSYLTTGTSPNRILTVEWNRMSWRAPTGTSQISFQVILHETTNVIDFIYHDEGIPLGSLPTASIGLAGIADGDYYSLDSSTATAVASKTVNTTDINSKPADGQMYTWTPGIVSSLSHPEITSAISYVHFDKETNHLTLSCELNKTGDLLLEIFDILGRPVYKETLPAAGYGKQQFRVSPSLFSSGTYVARISEKNLQLQNLQLQAKFIKN